MERSGQGRLWPYLRGFKRRQKLALCESHQDTQHAEGSRSLVTEFYANEDVAF